MKASKSSLLEIKESVEREFIAKASYYEDVEHLLKLAEKINTAEESLHKSIDTRLTDFIRMQEKSITNAVID